MLDELEEIYIKTLDAIRLTEIARISALAQVEFNGFVYGIKKGKKFFVKGVVPVYEKGGNNEVDNYRTEMYIKMLKRSNPNYLFFNYHTHPNGLKILSEDDLEVIEDGVEFLLWAKATREGFLRKKLCKVSYGIIKAFNVFEENGKKKMKEIPIRIKHSHKL